MSKSRPHRRVYKPTPSKTDSPARELCVSDVLSAQAEIRSTEIRTVGPALIVIAEVDAPLRLDVIADGAAEMEVLKRFIDHDDRLRLLTDVYRCERDELDFVRESAHHDRLARGVTSGR